MNPDLQIICEDSVTLGAEIFSTLGTVQILPPDAIDNEALRETDLLVIRSKTKISREKVEGSRLRLIGTATAGSDHMDLCALDEQGIAHYAAAGCNANSVSEYVSTALLELAVAKGFELAGLCLGIVGHGHVGKRVEAKARALGMTVLLNDPPLRDPTGDERYLPLEELLSACDVLTLHVPLERSGPHPTPGLIGPAELARLHDTALLINASRGQVLDGAALAARLDAVRLRACVLDVWDPEPEIPRALLERVDIGSAHIAGHSFEGKLNGTVQVYEEACRLLGCAPNWDPAPHLPPNDAERYEIDPAGQSLQEILLQAVRKVYDIYKDDRLLRALPDPIGPGFKKLRGGYRIRREFAAVPLQLSRPHPAAEAVLKELGFRVS